MPNSLCVFRCQAHGHAAAVCRKATPRFEKCARGHGTKECVVSVKEAVCVNCRDAHVAGDQKCPVREAG